MQAARKQQPRPLRRSVRRARKQRARVAAILSIGLLLMAVMLIIALSRG